MPRGINQFNGPGMVPKTDILASLIGNTGMSTDQAKREVGLKYRLNKPAWEKVKKAREGFMLKYIKATRGKEFGPEFTVKRLKEVAEKSSSPREDFNAVMAIKVHLGIMSRVVDPGGLFVQQNTGIFILPSEGQQWSQRAKAVSIPVETVDNPVEMPKYAK